MKVKYQIAFILLLSGWISACQNSDNNNGVQPKIQFINIPDNQLKSDPGATLVIEAEISSEEELTGIYYFVQRKDRNNHIQEVPYEYNFDKEKQNVHFKIELYTDENLTGIRIIAQGKNAKQEERVQIIVNSFVKFQMDKEKLITISGEKVEVKGTITPIGNVQSSYYETLNANKEVIHKENFQVAADGSFSFPVTPDENTSQLRLVVENKEGIGVTSLPVITGPYMEEGTLINYYYNIKLTTALDGTPYFAPDVKPYALTMEQARSNQQSIEFVFVNMVNVAPKWAGIGLCVFANNIVATTVAASEYVEGMTYPEGDSNYRRFVYHSLMAEWPFDYDSFTDNQISLNQILNPELDWTSNGILRFNDARHGASFGFKLQDERKAIGQIIKTEGEGYDAVIYLNFKCMR
ncbi:hypothetical protein [Bacteroides sp.]